MDIKKHLENIKKQRRQAKALSLLRVMQRSGLYPHDCKKHKQNVMDKEVFGIEWECTICGKVW